MPSGLRFLRVLAFTVRRQLFVSLRTYGPLRSKWTNLPNILCTSFVSINHRNTYALAISTQISQKREDAIAPLAPLAPAITKPAIKPLIDRFCPDHAIGMTRWGYAAAARRNPTRLPAWQRLGSHAQARSSRGRPDDGPHRRRCDSRRGEPTPRREPGPNPTVSRGPPTLTPGNQAARPAPMPASRAHRRLGRALIACCMPASLPRPASSRTPASRASRARRPRRERTGRDPGPERPAENSDGPGGAVHPSRLA